MILLRPVARVDVDILPRKIAGPIEPLSGALMDTNRDSDFFGFEWFPRLFRGNRRGCPLPEYAQPPEINIDLKRIELDTGPADRRQDPSPIGIFTVGGSLHERRRRD